MKRTTLLSTALLAIAGLAGAAESDGGLIPIDQVPVEVRTAIEREAQGVPVTDIERDIEDGRVVYEVKVKQAGLDRRFTVAEDGSVVTGRSTTPMHQQVDANGEQLTLTDLPEPVRAVVETRTAGHEIRGIERGLDEGREVFHVRIRQDGLDQRLTVASDGTVIADRDFKPGDDAGHSSGSEGDEDAWQDTKQGTREAWEKTKEGSGKAWDKTKQVSGGAWTDARAAFDEDGLTLETVPAPVAATLRAEAGSNEVQDIDVEAKGGKIWYEAEIRVKDGRNRSILIAEDGALRAD
ncbi:MAG: PepSY-like domain-containing protein [Planctomycetes bacterium]|nr:PepSY-like domain-containing protein [Planctomycetota bacterium]